MKAKTPKKSKLQKRIDDPYSTYWLKRADDAWADLIHTGYRSCVINKDCSGPLEAHHLINRKHYATRHNPWCGLLLCSKHHQWSVDLSAHIASLPFAEWLQINRPKQWEWVCEHKNDVGKPNWKEEIDELKKLKSDCLSKESLKCANACQINGKA